MEILEKIKDLVLQEFKKGKTMFYWIAVHHWQHGDEEKIFEGTRFGQTCLEDYMWEKVNAGWSVVRLEVRNRNQKC